MIANRGKNSEGVYTFRINATLKDDLELIIQEAKDAGFRFWKKPIIEKAHKTYSVLLQIYIPRDFGYPEESSEEQIS
jgi:hypothetical protein